MKFKIGDKVRVRKDLRTDTGLFRRGVVNSMIQYAGKELTIQNVLEMEYYTVKENTWVWSGDMFEPVGTRKIVIVTDGTTTTAKLYAGKNLVRESKAVCSEADTFSFEEGAKIALKRVMKEPEQFPEALVCIKTAVKYFTVGKKYLVNTDCINHTIFDDDKDSLEWFIKKGSDNIYYINVYPNDAEFVPFIDSEEN